MKLKGLYPKTDTGIFYYQPPMVKGVRPAAISLGTTNEEEAVEIYYRTAKEAKREFAAESLRMEAARYVAEMLKRGKHTERTSEETERLLAKFADFTANPPVGKVLTSHVVAFRSDMESRGLSDGTIHSDLSRLSGFFSWVYRQGLIKEHPCKRVDLPTALPTRSERY